MNVLITGITGFLGEQVGRECNNLGYKVFGLVRDSKVRAENFNFPVEIRSNDLRNTESIGECLNGINVIIHCAANTEMGAYGNKDQDKINVDAVENLVEASIELKIQRFIFISTANTLKPGNLNSPGTEMSIQVSNRSRLNYINSKIKAEALIKKAVSHRGLNAVILNPTFLIGPVRKEASSTKLFFHILRKKMLFYPKGGKNLVDVRDVARASVNAIKNGKSGENYILSNVNMTFKEIYSTTCKIGKSKPFLLPITTPILRSVGMLGSLAELILRKPIMLNHKSAKILDENHFYSNKKANSELDFSPSDTQLSIEQMVYSIQSL